MVQVMTKACHEGQCEHAPFPHKIAETELLVRARVGQTKHFETKTVGVRQFVVCLACHHWPRPDVPCNCRYDCHNAGIKSSFDVLD